MTVVEQAQRNGMNVMQQARLNEMRRRARSERIAAQADRLLSIYHGELIEDEYDRLPF